MLTTCTLSSVNAHGNRRTTFALGFTGSSARRVCGCARSNSYVDVLQAKWQPEKGKWDESFWNCLRENNPVCAHAGQNLPWLDRKTFGTNNLFGVFRYQGLSKTDHVANRLLSNQTRFWTDSRWWCGWAQNSDLGGYRSNNFAFLAFHRTWMFFLGGPLVRTFSLAEE